MVNKAFLRVIEQIYHIYELSPSKFTKSNSKVQFFN